MKSDKQQLPAGSLIGGRYSLVRPLGQGGMAKVYLAQDRQRDDALVAVKILHDELTNDPEFVKRFATEARAASSLNHPNIVKVLDYGHSDGLRYIIQEYVEGQTLNEMISQQGALPWQTAVPLAIQIGLALEHAHKNGIVHRDIKPHNIMITPRMIAKVTDFGIARAANSSTITLTAGVTFGSVHYFSPEQARGSLVGEKSDIYSLGILLYEMVTGQVPFDGETSVAIAIKHLQEMPQLPSALRADLPPNLDDIIIKCIQKSPDNRYESARDLVDELDAFMVDPEGIYGILAGSGSDHANTTAIGLKRPDANYGKLRDIEQAIVERRRSRQRDIAIIVAIVLVSMAFLAAIGSWTWDKIKDSLQTQPMETVFAVQDYRGRNLDEVLGLFAENDVKYRIEYRDDDNIAEGIIIDQYPPEGIEIKPTGTTILLYVSGGQNLITIPDYTGESQTIAKAELEQTYGFTVSVQYGYSDLSKGRIIKTVPAANARAPKGSEIVLFVSEGLPQIVMPDFSGRLLTDAIDELVPLNLVLGPVHSIGADPDTGEPVDIPANKRIVLKQSPAPGKEVMALTLVTFTYGSQQDYYYYHNPTPIPTPTPEPSPTPEPDPDPDPTDPDPDPTEPDPDPTEPEPTSAPPDSDD